MLRRLSRLVVAPLLMAIPHAAFAGLALVGNPTGITMTSFASGFPPSANTPGPLGIAFRVTGTGTVQAMVAHYGDAATHNSHIYFIPDVNGYTGPYTAIPSATYSGTNNALGLAQISNGAGGYRYFMSQYSNNRVVEIDSNGALTGLSFTIPAPEAIVAYPDDGFAPSGSLTNHLFVSSAAGKIHDIDLTTNLVNPQTLTATGVDGLAISPDGATLYAALSSSGVVGAFDLSNFSPTQVPTTSAFIAFGVDGIALGAGCRTGYLYVNTTGGQVYQVPLPVPGVPPGPNTLIATGGTRGDFVAADPYVLGPGGMASLLLTQGNEIFRLSFDNGGVFGPPWSAAAPQGAAQLSLTSAGVMRGFRLTTYMTGPTGAFEGPLGIAFGSNHEVAVTQFGNSGLYLLPNHNDPNPLPSQPISTYRDLSNNLVPNNAVGLAQLNGPNGVRYFMTQYTNGRVLEIDLKPNGMATPIVSIPHATGIVPFPPGATVGVPQHLGHLFVSNGSNIYEVDPDAPSATLFASAPNSDGLAFSPDGGTLYVAIASPSHIAAYDLSGNVGWTSPGVGTALDGLAIGEGALAGYIYGNTQGGEVWEFALPPAPPSATLVARGGSRGDFIATDPEVQCCDSQYPSLLLTQSDRIMRLDPPHGGWFGPPTSSDAPIGGANLPMAGTWVIVLCSAATAFTGLLFLRRRSLGR